MDTVFWLCPSLPTETLKWLSSLPILMQESFWWWQCSDRYIISLSPPPPPIPFPPFSPSLISLMVSVDVKHDVYLLTPENCLVFSPRVCPPASRCVAIPLTKWDKLKRKPWSQLSVIVRYYLSRTPHNVCLWLISARIIINMIVGIQGKKEIMRHWVKVKDTGNSAVTGRQNAVKPEKAASYV